MRKALLTLVVLLVAAQSWAATTLSIPGGWYGEARPNGAYAVSLLDGRVQTDSGVRVVPQPGDHVLYLRLAVDGQRFAGQAHSGAGSWEWDGQQWQLRANPAFGISGLIYDASDTLVFAVPGVTGTQGFRYVEDGTGRLVTGDETYADASRRIWEYTTHGDVTIGQGLAGCIAIRGEVRVTLRDGDCRFVRFNRDGNQLAVAMVDLPHQTTELLWLYVNELASFPAEALPPALPLLPGPTFPAPVPAPAPQGGVCDLAHAVILGGSPDVRGWTETTQITQLRVGHDGVELNFSKRGAGGWPDVRPPGWDGDLQYTLWLCMVIDHTSYAAGIIEYWHDLTASGGDITESNQIPSNWTYYVPPMDRQPAAGEQLSFFVTAGDQRMKDVHAVAERSNVVTIPYPTAPQTFVFGGAPSPLPAPVPAPTPDPLIAALQAQIVTLQAQVSTLQRTVEADAAQETDLTAQIAVLQARIVDLQNRPAPSCVAKVPAIIRALGIKIGCSVQ